MITSIPFRGFDERGEVRIYFVVMPNHVHVLMRTTNKFELEEVLQAIKSYRNEDQPNVGSLLDAVKLRPYRARKGTTGSVSIVYFREPKKSKSEFGRVCTANITISPRVVSAL